MSAYSILGCRLTKEIDCKGGKEAGRGPSQACDKCSCPWQGERHGSVASEQLPSEGGGQREGCSLPTHLLLPVPRPWTETFRVTGQSTLGVLLPCTGRGLLVSYFHSSPASGCSSRHPGVSPHPVDYLATGTAPGGFLVQSSPSTTDLCSSAYSLLGYPNSAECSVRAWGWWVSPGGFRG